MTTQILGLEYVIRSRKNWENFLDAYAQVSEGGEMGIWAIDESDTRVLIAHIEEKQLNDIVSFARKQGMKIG